MSERATPFEQELAQALGHPVEPIEIPAEVDEAILARAVERAAVVRRSRRRRRRRVLRWAAPAAAVAAAVALVVVLPLTWSADPGAASEAVAAGPDDVNRDGRVDILDAYALARSATDAGRGDVERVALAAVSLGEGGAR